MKTLLFLMLLLSTSGVSAQISWRVSVKFVLDASGKRAATGSFTTDDNVTAMINTANTVLDSTGRGYRYALTEITNAMGISQWFNSDRTNSALLEIAAEADKAGYLYRDNAINVYIVGWDGTAVCSFPHALEGTNDIIFMGQASFQSSFAHEAGHYFDLLHTFQGEVFMNRDNTPCTTNDCTCALWAGGNADLIPDTLNDHECWETQNDIAGGNYGVLYGAPGCDNAAVDRIYNNIMSYRTSVRNLLTEDQMDRMTDTSNGIRFKVATARTRFVAGGGNDQSGDGSSGNRYRTLNRGIQAADPGDVVLLQGGHYNEPQSLTKPVTLRATRGDVVLGVP